MSDVIKAVLIALVCPLVIPLVVVGAVGGALRLWADQSVNEAKDEAEIVIEEPKEEQDYE